MKHTHQLPNCDDTEIWTVEYIIHPGEPQIMPEQQGCPPEMEILSVKNEQGREIKLEEISAEEWRQIEDECWEEERKFQEIYFDV